MSDSAVGTTWRTIRALFFMILIASIVFLLFSVGVAVSTSDKTCGNARLDNGKTWNYFPPRWECPSTP